MSETTHVVINRGRRRYFLAKDESGKARVLAPGQTMALSEAEFDTLSRYRDIMDASKVIGLESSVELQATNAKLKAENEKLRADLEKAAPKASEHKDTPAPDAPKAPEAAPKAPEAAKLAAPAAPKASEKKDKAPAAPKASEKKDKAPK